MVDLSDVESIRGNLALLCQMPDARAVPANAGVVRHRWEPFRVQDRAALSNFTDAGAWEFIAECIAGGCEIEYKPPDAEFDDHAYIIIDKENGFRDIYIKIALNMSLRKIIGISFHYAEY
jgi:hypothetical protein